MKPLVMVLGMTAAVLLALGLVLGFRPLTADGRDCGSAFHHNPYVIPYVPACAQERSDALVLPIVLLGLGLLAGASSVIVRRSAPDAPESARA